MVNGDGVGGVVVVVGNPRPGSRTTRVGLAVADRLGEAFGDGRETIVVELADVASELFLPESERASSAQDVVQGAAALVVASPVYKATYTGLLKAFLDRFGAGSLDGLPCAAVMLGGSPAHSMAVEVHLRPVLTEIGASTLPGCYVTEPALDDLDAELDPWWARSRRLLRLSTADHDAQHHDKESPDVHTAS